MEVPRRSLAASVSPLRLIDRRKSFSYNQLPEEPIKLTVLKLDGSSFGTTATVRDLKMAVEAAFSHLPITSLGNNISCLLWINIIIHLRFVRYISNHCILMKTHKSKTPGVSSLKQLKL
ncbi:hypothetical protein F2Q69_00057826 [Brassica cretica]|uniref:SNRNP25 ubiquitin-like domain-containing protein n=1 Tax=Brassica cretica TaxID=69181 RepID=A0A8S9ML63_BRACR|nr:hypothetical protein F2Q69_00057826 [Brassica cretica]